MLSAKNISLAKYKLLSTSDLDLNRAREEEQVPRRAYWCLRKQFVLLFVTVIVSLGFGYLLGQQYHPLDPQSRGGLLAPSGSKPETWHHNYTFSASPNPESEAAWASLIPVGRGFIQNPQTGPEIKSIAVFHQLHCLHGLRISYYNALHRLEVLNGTATPDAYLERLGHQHQNEVSHLRHCFDLLRRALMCAADTNLEVVHQESFTTTGWGFERKCRDYEGVREWAERYRGADSGGIQ